MGNKHPEALTLLSQSEENLKFSISVHEPEQLLDSLRFFISNQCLKLFL